MSNLTMLVFFVTIFVIGQHGLAQNFTTADSIETQADGREEIMNSSLHRRHRYRHARFTKYIVNGFPAKKGQFPYQVAIHNKSDMAFISNGAIISARHVVSEASIICKSRGGTKIAPQDLEVHAGMVRLHAHDLQSYDVQDTVCHEQYHFPDSVIHAIVLIRTKKSFQLSAVVQRIEMSTMRYGPGLDVTTSGWGTTTGKGVEVSELLHYSDTFTLSLEDCKQRLVGYPIDKVLSPGTGCTHSLERSSGPYAWHYDNGAPMVHRGLLVGVVTHIYIGVQVDGYVSVPHHLDWIWRQVTGKN